MVAAHPSNYDKFPTIRVSDQHPVWTGVAAWTELARAVLAQSGDDRSPVTPVIVVDAYPGVEIEELLASARAALPSFTVIDVETAAARPIDEINSLISRNLTADRVFGVLSHHTLDEFYSTERLQALADAVRTADTPHVLIGWGAALVPVAGRVLVLADLARWQIQTRQRAGAPNWRAENGGEDHLRKVKRGYFVEWRVADRHKRDLLSTMDFVLDTNASTAEPKLIAAATFLEAMERAVNGPYRVVPFFDPGVWGGQWMKEVCDLDRDVDNFAWCFDCVPEENSILLAVRDQVLELPALDVVLTHPRELLGELTFARFGAEFPIRFDFLDTMGGGNLSLQVHPLTDYIQATFGMTYTQDESYYLLDAEESAVVYLGLKEGIQPGAMMAALTQASEGGSDFVVDGFVNRYPAKKHDHFSIPAGTVHASGAGSMVLEISATPYLFTFKMWDWGRLGLDGRPRPIHLDHAARNVQWDRTTGWTGDNLVGRVEVLSAGDGWTEERTGLHELEFIEVRRHWFTGMVPHDTRGTVHVVNLVEGREAVVESPTDTFPPFTIHYAETFIVPAAVGSYTIRPSGESVGQRLATVTAFVRGTERGARSFQSACQERE